MKRVHMHVMLAAGDQPVERACTGCSLGCARVMHARVVAVARAMPQRSGSSFPASGPHASPMHALKLLGRAKLVGLQRPAATGAKGQPVENGKPSASAAAASPPPPAAAAAAAASQRELLVTSRRELVLERHFHLHVCPAAAVYLHHALRAHHHGIYACMFQT